MTERHLCNRGVIGGSIVCFLLGAGGGLLWLAPVRSAEEPIPAEKAVAAFLKQVAERKVTAIKVYYCSWGAMPNSPIYEESELTERYRDYEIVVRRMAAWDTLDHIADALRRYKLSRMSPHTLDFRIGCIFYAGEKEVMRLFVSKNSPAISINATTFDATPGVVHSLLPLLPMAAYEDMCYGMVADWCSPGFWKDMVTTQQKQEQMKYLK